MIIMGMDLSGPSNTEDTAVVVFGSSKKGLERETVLNSATDQDIVTLLNAYHDHPSVVAGIDAPLSYNPGGGDRPGDAGLRKTLTAAGMLPGSVMTPTMTRMVYLTLRGMGVARLIQQCCPDAALAEVHPGGAMALRGASVADVRSFKKSPGARTRLLAWMEAQGIGGAASEENPSDHYVAACAAALGAWGWHRGNPAWQLRAKPPIHPFDYVC
ncbi:MAG: DUF429 domain-containing protein [Desulfobacterales bacterium]|nr:DUF429 domain-containing protein [Desulfobacterales bacterium]